jgi:hypothetical protein
MLFCENGAASMPGDPIQNEILAALPRNEYERIFPFLQLEQWLGRASASHLLPHSLARSLFE